MIPIAKPIIEEAEKAAVLNVLDSGVLAGGEVVAEFERSFADYIGVQHGIATSCGTTALEIALRALGIGTGDKVITTVFSFIASANSILYTGAVPAFADIDPLTFNITADSIAAALDKYPDSRAVLIVHLFGQSCDMDAIKKLTKERGLLLIEDCSQAHGAKWKGKKVGSFGNAATFSFYPTKNMTTGEGGMVVTNNDETADKARLLINHGMKMRYKHDVLGYNYRMTNIAAAIGIEQLRRLDGFNVKRRENANVFNAHINNPLVMLPSISPDALHVFHQYSIRIKNAKRRELIGLLERERIGYGVFYPTTIPEQSYYAKLGFNTTWENADIVKEQILSIPVHPLLTKDDLYRVVGIVNSLE